MTKHHLARHQQSKVCKNNKHTYKYKTDADIELKKCNKCKKTLTLDHYYIHPHGDHFKLCKKCVDKAIEYKEKWNCEIKCEYCGDRTTKTCKSIHKRKYWCKTSQIITRPSFDEWLITQDYDNMLS